jgi:hypothetical protein
MMVDKPKDDELTVLANADSRQRVCRVLGTLPVALFQRDDPTAAVIAHVPPETLLVVFDYGNKMRQVLTPDQTFGYIPRATKLERVDMHPQEVFHAAERAKAEKLAPLPEVESKPLAMAAAAAAGATPAVQPSPEQPAVAAPQPATPPPVVPAQANAPAPDVPPRLSPAIILGAAFLGIIAVAGIVVAIVLLLSGQ